MGSGHARGLIYTGSIKARFAYAITVPVRRLPSSESTQPRREYLEAAKAGHITRELARRYRFFPTHAINPSTSTHHGSLRLSVPFRSWRIALYTVNLSPGGAFVPSVFRLCVRILFCPCIYPASASAPAPAPPWLCTSRLTSPTEQKRTWTCHFPARCGEWYLLESRLDTANSRCLESLRYFDILDC